MTPEEAVKIIKRERDSMRRLADDCDLPITGGHEYIEAYDMAISALEKQISEETGMPERKKGEWIKKISKKEKDKEYIGYTPYWYCPDDDGSCNKADRDIRELLDDLENLPSAQPEQHWIPCSERLPEDGRYLCTYSNEKGICVDFGLVTNGKWYIEPSAWMPLPEPYEGE